MDYIRDIEHEISRLEHGQRNLSQILLINQAVMGAQPIATRPRRRQMESGQGKMQEIKAPNRSAAGENCK
jgi:hypothetical protein